MADETQPMMAMAEESPMMAMMANDDGPDAEARPANENQNPEGMTQDERDRILGMLYT